jgi:hypothetical protein
MLYLGTAPISSTVFYRRSALEKRQWNEGSKLEDYELYLQLAEDGEFAFDPTVLAAWRKHDLNTSRDLDFMLNECLAAQDRVAGKLGWDDRKVEEVHTRTRFFFSGEYDRAGLREKARALLFANLRGARSWRVLARALVRSATPEFILGKRKTAIRGRQNVRYGSVEI